MDSMNLKESVDKFVLEKKDYYQQWMFDEPIIISKTQNEKLSKIQKILYKLIYEFVSSYQKYKHLMPVDSKVASIIEVFNKKKYEVGTYRTDFVFDEGKKVKLIEITCRFALNGVFLSELINQIAFDFQKKKHPLIKVEKLFQPIYKCLEERLKGLNSIYILTGDDKRNESKIYTEIFNRIGYQIKNISYKDIENDINLMQNSWVISELSFDEIKSLSETIIEKLASLNVINDFRTVFLIHDKRFFSVLGKKELLENVLTTDEIDFFNEFYIPTYTYAEEKEIWKKAMLEKDKWILKHRALGKSKKIYAGIVTEEDVWRKLFNDVQIKDMILQEWIPQSSITGSIAGENFKDYITGTLLYFDDNYFGLGDFRTSSHPVTNIVDHRKATSLILSDDKELTALENENYIIY